MKVCLTSTAIYHGDWRSQICVDGMIIFSALISGCWLISCASKTNENSENHESEILLVH